MGESDLMFAYKVEDLTVSLSTEEYVKNYGNCQHAIDSCKKCKNYLKVWACPPFKHDTMGEISQYSNVLLIATKLTPIGYGSPSSEIDRIYIPERRRVEKALLDMEEEYNGRAFAFAGSCLYCPDETCSRIDNHPCRHPELVRSSLEAYGFDIGKTVKELFGFTLLWSRRGFLPRYLTLVSGFFHNSDRPVIFPKIS